MIFCGETILPGEQKRVQLPVPDAKPLECVCLCGKNPGWTLVVTAGVHGCEYVGVQALRILARELIPDAMTGNVILLPLANPYGFYAGAKRVIPEDGVNLNGAFPGDRNGSLGRRLAFALEDALYSSADFLADLHSGDCNESLHPLVFFPTAGEKDVNAAALEAAKALSVDYRVRSTARNGLYSWAVQRGVPALLIERGGQGRWSQPEVDACKADVYALMGHLGILPGGEKNRVQQEIVEANYVESDADGFWYPLVAKNQDVCMGELLGRLESLTGELLQEVRAKFDGVVLYHTVALGVHMGEALIAYGHT